LCWFDSVEAVTNTPQLVVLTGPIAAGKTSVATELARRLTGRGHLVVVADVDDVAAMVGPPGAGAVGLWFAAHEAHGALVAQWMRSAVDHIVAVGPIYTHEEQAALTRTLPAGATPLWVVIDAPVSVTMTRAENDPARGLSRNIEFHQAAHRRFRELAPKIPASATFDSSALGPDDIAAAIEDLLAGR
jgi:adenylylsulfate kinase-like enzyme